MVDRAGPDREAPSIIAADGAEVSPLQGGNHGRIEAVEGRRCGGGNTQC